jgi:TIR domain-containing protein/uncharacterized protein DUF4190
MPYQVLISNAAADSSVASQIDQALKEGGFDCLRWQPEAAPIGDASVTSLVDRSDALVLILSPATPDSVLVRSQVEYALAGGKEIIPFRLNASPLPKHLEFYLSTAHWLETSTPPQPEDMRRLVSAIRYSLGMDQPRLAKKAIVSIVLGVLGILGLGIVLGPLAVFLGRSALKSIAAGRSSERGRKYAWIGVVLGCVALLCWIAVMVQWWYTGINPSEDLIKWLQGT